MDPGVHSLAAAGRALTRLADSATLHFLTGVKEP